MGRISLMRFRSSRHWRAAGLIVGMTTLLLFFQNCGKAGMDHGEDTSSALTDTPDVKKFKAAPFPFDVKVNQVAFMTCPAATTSVTFGEDVEAPFFTFRVGAFDNRVLASRYPALFDSLVDPERTGRLSAGVGLSADFMTYMKSQFGSRLANLTKAEDKQRLYRNAILNSQHKYKISSGLVLRQRNSSNGFAWSDKHAKPILNTLTDTNIANQLSLLPDMGTFGTEKLHEVTGVEIPQRSFVSSIMVPANESQRDQFRSNLMNYEFVVGYTKPEFEGDVFSLASPTNDNNFTLYGHTYRFTTTQRWPGRVDRAPVTSGGVTTIAENTNITSKDNDFLAGVEEWDVSAKGSPVNVTATEGQKWDCFSLMIVRESDRRDPQTERILDPGEYGDPVGSRNCALWGAGCSVKRKYYDYQATATSPIIPAIKTACPIQEVGTSTRYGSINYTGDNSKTGLRLEIARRFLPAEYWDVNTHPEYMCAVPKPSTKGFGSCYSSGNFDASKYILYVQKATETINNVAANVTCGMNPYTGQVQKECPAFVSLCYRTR